MLPPIDSLKQVIDMLTKNKSRTSHKIHIVSTPLWFKSRRRVIANTYSTHFFHIKMLFLSLIILFLILSLSGCVEKELINDTTTGEIFPVENTNALLDGRYSATTSFYDARGYVQKLDILIKSSIITQVNFTEISKSGSDRITLEGPEKTWNDLEMLNLNSLYLRLYNALILSQNPDEIDAVSGATQTSERFINLSKAVIEQAQKGDHEPIKIDTFDTYTVVSQIDPEGFQGNMVATFNGSTLTAMTYDEIRAEDGKSRRKMTDYSNNINFAVLFDTLIHDTLASQTFESSSPENELPPEKMKFTECLRLLKDLRTPF